MMGCPSAHVKLTCFQNFYFASRNPYIVQIARQSSTEIKIGALLVKRLHLTPSVLLACRALNGSIPYRQSALQTVNPFAATYALCRPNVSWRRGLNYSMASGVDGLPSQDPSSGQTYPKTHAKELYCLTDKDLEPLQAQEKRNPYVRKGTPMKLYKQADLEEAAVKRWGSLEELEEEKNKRVEKREKRALEKAKEGEKDAEELEFQDGEEQARASAEVLDEGELHPLIKERIKVLQNAKPVASGKYVLYWMSTAVRDHENPALDVARHEAASRKLPLLVASFLLKNHTYPTHRRYKFLLEGLRDVQTSLATKGLPHLIFIEGISCTEDGKVMDGWDAVMKAVSDAALVVTEIMPTPPYTTWKKNLMEQTPDHVDIWLVDTACLVPVTLFSKGYAAAYAFRKQSSKLRDERLKDLPYPNKRPREVDAEACKKASEGISWTSVDLEGANAEELLQRSDAFDESVPGVSHMPGGQKAGNARWEAFKKNGLSQYAARRNNAMLRDAARGGTRGAQKFADEFLTWRELAYCFCYHNSDTLETMQILPTWSQRTLTAHKHDKREIKSQEQLEKGTTGDEIWDALQHQLYTTGELHNNVRMTWGKALLPWTPDPETALKQTFHLNHKFALDGCDPSSYGGILWCFGQFDGPKGAESTPIFGSLRNRPTHLLTRKLNAERFRSLPLDGTALSGLGSGGGSTKTPISSNPPAEGTQGKDLRNLFAQAAHETEDRPNLTGADAAPRQNDAARQTSSPPPSPGAKSPATKKRPAKGQQGIESFFKRTKS